MDGNDYVTVNNPNILTYANGQTKCDLDEMRRKLSQIYSEDSFTISNGYTANVTQTEIPVDTVKRLKALEDKLEKIVDAIEIIATDQETSESKSEQARNASKQCVNSLLNDQIDRLASLDERLNDLTKTHDDSMSDISKKVIDINDAIAMIRKEIDKIKQVINDNGWPGDEI